MFNEAFKHGRKFNVNADSFPFTTLTEVIKENGHRTFTVNGVFIYEAKYGKRPVLIADGLKIHLPDHCIKDVQKILDNDDFCNAINEGKCGFKTGEYKDDKNVLRYTGTFVDI